MSAMVNFRVINMGVLPTNKFWGETERVHPVSASCTLLESGGKRLLVDPSPRPPELKQLLYDNAGLRPEAIDQVFLTHWHGDHLFGIELFPNAEWLMSEAGLAEWRQAPPQVQTHVDRFLPAEGRLPAGIQLFPSPGHTLAHCSLLAQTPWGALIVAGDAVMAPEYFEAEEGYRNAVDFALSTRTIQAIDRLECFQPAHARHTQVSEKQVEGLAARGLDGLGAAPDPAHLIAILADGAHTNLAHKTFVFGDHSQTFRAKRRHRAPRLRAPSP